MRSPVQEWRAEKQQRIGAAVVEQAHDSSIDNTEPIALRQIISQILGIVVTLLLFKGILEPQEGRVVIGQSEIIVGAIFSLAGIAGAVAGRMRAYSPKTAAKIAIANAEKPAGALPTLLTPP